MLLVVSHYKVLAACKLTFNLILMSLMQSVESVCLFCFKVMLVSYVFPNATDVKGDS